MTGEKDINQQILDRLDKLEGEIGTVTEERDELKDRLAKSEQDNENLRNQTTDLLERLRPIDEQVIDQEDRSEDMLASRIRRSQVGRHLWMVSFDDRKPSEIEKGMRFPHQERPFTCDSDKEEGALGAYVKMFECDGKNVKLRHVGKNKNYVAPDKRKDLTKVANPITAEETETLRETGGINSARLIKLRATKANQRKKSKK